MWNMWLTLSSCRFTCKCHSCIWHMTSQVWLAVLHMWTRLHTCGNFCCIVCKVAIIDYKSQWVVTLFQYFMSRFSSQYDSPTSLAKQQNWFTTYSESRCCFTLRRPVTEAQDVFPSNSKTVSKLSSFQLKHIIIIRTSQENMSRTT